MKTGLWSDKNIRRAGHCITATADGVIHPTLLFIVSINCRRASRQNGSMAEPTAVNLPRISLPMVANTVGKSVRTGLIIRS